jgi:hypothetical protein
MLDLNLRQLISTFVSGRQQKSDGEVKLASPSRLEGHLVHTTALARDQARELVALAAANPFIF